MWHAVTQAPARALGLGLRLWALYLDLLSLGLQAVPLGLLVLLRTPCVCALSAAGSAILWVKVCSVCVLLQGLAWAAQLAGSWVTLHVWLFCALLDGLRRLPLIPLCERGAGWLVRAGVQTGSALAQLRGVVAFVQLCAHALCLGASLCVHICFAAVSSKVRVRVHLPFRFSLPVRVHAPLNLGIKVKLQGQKPSKAPREAGAPRGEVREAQKPHTSSGLRPTRSREVSPSRSELSSVVPSAATLIIVLCVGFLVLMVVLGLLRIHSLHRRVAGSGGSPEAAGDPKDPDLFWDDSALTIIVNPMESYQSRQAGVAGAAEGQPEDEDSSDSEAADSPSSDERRIIEGPPHRY